MKRRARQQWSRRICRRSRLENSCMFICRKYFLVSWWGFTWLSRSIRRWLLFTPEGFPLFLFSSCECVARELNRLLFNQERSRKIKRNVKEKNSKIKSVERKTAPEVLRKMPVIAEKTKNASNRRLSLEVSIINTSKISSCTGRLRHFCGDRRREWS